jgi:DNA polymerase/3'-5' exonuclease PolX
MKDYKNKILQIFETILLYHQIHNENQYIIKSYINVIHQIYKYKKPLNEKTDLKSIEGIGKGFQEKIETIIKTGSLDFYDKIKKNKNFEGLSKISKISGIGPKKLEEIQKLGINNIEELKNAIKNKKIKVSSMTKLHLEYYKDLEKKLNRKEIENSVQYIIKLLNLNKNDFIISGSYLMGKKQSKDIDLIIINQNIDYILEILNKNGLLIGILMKGENSANILIKINNNYVRHIDIRTIQKKYLPYYLLYFGSGVNFSRWIRQKAKEKGYKLDQYGLYKNGKNINFYPKYEKDIFKFLDLTYIDYKNR